MKKLGVSVAVESVTATDDGVKKLGTKDDADNTPLAPDPVTLAENPATDVSDVIENAPVVFCAVEELASEVTRAGSLVLMRVLVIAVSSALLGVKKLGTSTLR